MTSCCSSDPFRWPARFLSDDADLVQDECGIFGIFCHNETESATNSTFFALHALQHRGQEMAGIATFDGSTINTHKGIGLVSQIFTEEHARKLPGRVSVGHTRYSTAGGKSLQNAQPFVLETDLGQVAVAHNGQLTRQKYLRKLLLARGTGLFTNSDSEILAQMLAHPASASPHSHSYLNTTRSLSPAPVSPRSPSHRPRSHQPAPFEPLGKRGVSISPSPPYSGPPPPQTSLSPRNALTQTYPPHTNSPTGRNHSSSISNGQLVKSPSHRDQEAPLFSQHLTLQRLPSYDDSSISYDGLVTIHRQQSLLDFERKSNNGSKLDHWQRRLVDLMTDAEGAYALVLLCPGAVYACRDRLGVRPLCLGEKKNADGTSNWAVSSESCAFGPIGYTYTREVLPGEIVRLSKQSGVTSIMGLGDHQKSILSALCVFEYVYFARPDTLLEDQLVHTVRQRFGRALAKHSPAVADIVAGVPDSSTAAAIGYSVQSGLPFMEVLCKNRYIGRTFIQPDQAMRENSIRLKFNPLSENLKGKSIVLVDDSLVRGNTLKRLIPLLKTAGATQVHIRISSPVLRHPCYMGVDIGTYDEILATHLPDVKDMCAFIGADSLEFLSHDLMIAAVLEGLHKTELSNSGHCSACFTGNYPMQLDIEDEARSMNRGHLC